MHKHPLLTRVTAASFRHPWRFLGVALLLTAVGAWLAMGLELKTSFEELLPSDYRSVTHAKELVRRIGGDGTVYVNVESLDGPQGMPRAEAMALKLADEYRALGPKLVRSVRSSIQPVADWYADHWPLFLDLGDLRQARDRLVSEIGKAKAQVNPLFAGLDEGEESAETSPISSTDPLLDPAKPSPRQQVLERFARFKNGFMVHGDQQSLTLEVRTAGSGLGVEESRELLDKMRAITEAHRSELDAAKLRIGLAGSVPTFLAEYEAITQDVFSTFSLVMGLLLLSILIFYREIRPVLAIGGVLVIAVAVTFGITRLVIGYLNTETAFLSSIVAGNGINYGIVYLTRVGQLRRKGVSLETACQEGAQTALVGTLLASLGTAVSFGTLMIAANRGFRHFGFIGGIGILLCWLATFVMMPAVMVTFERIWPARLKVRQTKERDGRHLRWLFAYPRTLIGAFALVGLTATAYFLWQLPSVMERNLDKLSNDPTGSAELRRDQARANASLGTSSAGVVALLPSPEIAEGYCQEILKRRADPRYSGLIDDCSTLTKVVPAQQEEKLQLIADIGGRLTDRVLSRLPSKQAERAREVRAQLTAQRPLRVEDAPAVLLDPFREKDGTLGRVAAVGAKHSAQLELGPNLRNFTEAVRNVPVGGETYDAAGATVVLADLFENIEREGPFTTALSFLGVCVLVALFFRSARMTAKLILSLTLGVVLMAAVATLGGIKINFFNFVVYPITFGIAVDYGANVLSRMHERRSAIPALAEVGGAVILCSWTTIIGYGSLLLSINRALRSFGWYAMLGEFTTLATALLMLPALALVFRPRDWSEGLPDATDGAAHSLETTHADK